MNPLFRAVFALGTAGIGLAAVLLAISEASDTTSHAFLEQITPAMDAAVGAVVFVVLLIAAVGVIAMVRWAIDTGAPGGGR